MGRALSTATLSLGLVAIPVALHATRRREGRISYHLVHAKDGSRVKRQYVCEEEGIPVDDAELARAYQGDDGEVVLSAEEAKGAAPKATGRIDLIEFVPVDTLDAIYFENAYFLAPGKGGDRAYHLLASTLRELGMIGVGTQLARGKSYLVALRPTPLGLTMHTLHHADEVHAEDAVPHGEAGKVTAAERDLARMLVEQLRRPAFDAAKFEDTADAALRAAIATHTPTPRKGKAAPHVGSPIDLLESLRASLEAQPTPGQPRTAATKPRRAGAKAATTRKAHGATATRTRAAAKRPHAAAAATTRRRSTRRAAAAA